MNKVSYTYNLRSFWLTWVIYELIFNALFALLLFQLDFFSSDQEVKDKLIIEHQEALYLLLFIPALFYIQFRSLKNRNNLSKNILNSKFQKLLFQPVQTRKVIFQFLMIRNCFFFLIIAMANPLLGKVKQSTKAENLELVVCLDVSNSMNVKDIDGTTRLEVAKRALTQLVNQMTGERIGICVFAGSAFVQLPLTMDYHAAKLFIQEIQSDMISAQGTNISEALSISDKMFTQLKTSKGILLVTDGEDHEGLGDTIVSSLTDKKVEIAILGIGTDKGGPVPVDIEKPGLGNKQTDNREMVISKLNPDFIKKLATDLNGTAIVTSEPFPNVNQVLTEINQMKRGNSRNLEIEINESWYQIPLLFVLISYALWVLSYWFKSKTNVD
jgi:Ca-activated chloride channel family protein